MVGHDTQIEEKEWYIGSILLEKYTIIFDSESKKLNLLKYRNSKKQIEEPKIENKMNIYIAVLITLFFTAIIFCFIGLRYGKKIYQSRKVKAKELNDGYDYSSYKEIDNKKRAIIPNDINSKNVEKGVNEYSLEMTNAQ